MHLIGKNKNKSITFTKQETCQLIYLLKFLKYSPYKYIQKISNLIYKFEENENFDNFKLDLTLLLKTEAQQKHFLFHIFALHEYFTQHKPKINKKYILSVESQDKLEFYLIRIF